MPLAKTSQCAAGEEALVRGEWQEAREAFETALRFRDSAEALEGLGKAAWWLDLADLVFDSRERAYRLYLNRSDRAAAARVAVWLAWDYWAFRGENAVANGWLQRARRLLEDEAPCSERAWLEVREGALSLMEDGDPAHALALADEGIRIACEIGDTDMEMLGRAVRGLTLVVSGSVAEGMRCLDEVSAAVMAGELTDLVAIGLCFCYMIAACEQVRDSDRAVQWCARLKVFSAQWRLRPLFAVCRSQYASICVWRGMWLEAEQELCAASDELSASRPAMRCDALLRLAELRRRQGRTAEAAALFNQGHGRGPGLLGQAEMALDRGDAASAAEHAARYLRGIPKQNRTDRISALELQVRASTELGERENAEAALEELVGIASQVATLPLRAAATLASGYVASGKGELDGARQRFEDAVDLFLRCGAPFEVARARIELARVLGALGREKAAIEEIGSAIGLLEGLKAEVEVTRARNLLATLRAKDRLEREAAPSTQTTQRSSGQLTRREIEVLRLVAEGLNNQTIAERLFLSDHTVHRHVANIFGKLSVSTRAAAVAQASRRGLLG